MVVVIGMPETTALERIWICTLCVQSPCSSNENMRAYFRLTRFTAFISGESVMSTPGKTPQGERCDRRTCSNGHNRAEDVSVT